MKVGWTQGTPGTAGKPQDDSLPLADLTKLAKNTGIAGLGELFYVPIVYVLNVLISRFLGAEGVGIYAQATVITLLVTLLARLGLDGGMLRFISYYLAKDEFGYIEGITSFVSRFTLITSLFLAGGLFLGAELLANTVLHEPQLAFVLRAFAATVPFLALTGIWLSGLQAFQRIDYRVLIERIFQPLTSLALIGLFLLLGMQWHGVAGAVILTALISSVFAYYLYRDVKRSQVQATARSPQLEIREWLGFSYPLLLSGLLAFVMGRMATLILGSLRTSAEVGLYEIALKVAQLVQLPLMVSNTIFAPMIGEMYAHGDIGRLQALFKIVTKWVFVGSFFIFLLSVLLARPLLAIFGSEFTAGTPALFLLGLGQLVNASTGAVGWMLVMSGRSRLHLFNAAVSALLMILLSYLLTPEYGIIGTAIGVGLTLVVVNVLRLIEVLYLMKIHPYRRDFLKPATAGLLAFGLSYFFQRLVAGWAIPSLGQHVITGAAFALSYFALLVLFRFNADEWELLRWAWQRITASRVPAGGG